MFIGTVLVWILVHASPPIALVTLLGLAAAGIWTFKYILDPRSTEADVERFMTELCVCGHTRREHQVELFGPPVCNECDCTWMAVPIVTGPWSPKFRSLRREHQNYILFLDAVVLGLGVLFVAASV